MTDGSNPLAGFESNPLAEADRLISRFGIALIVAFIMPLIGEKIVFLNIAGLTERGVPLIAVIELLYPLLAGAAVMVLAKKERTTGRGAGLSALGLLPFLLLFTSAEVRSALSGITRSLPGSGAMGLNLVLTFLAILALLAGAHASRVRPEQDLGAHVALAGGGLYIVSLFIPAAGRFPLLGPFKTLIAHDPTHSGIMVISGLVALASMALFVLMALRCLRLHGPIAERKQAGQAVIKLWKAQFYVYGAFLAYVLITSMDKAPGDAGTMILAFLTTVVKFVLWILGLYLLIPLGLAEMIIAGAPAAAPNVPAGTSAEAASGNQPAEP